MIFALNQRIIIILGAETACSVFAKDGYEDMKKTIAAVLAVMIAVLSAGCGSSDKSPTGEGPAVVSNPDGKLLGKVASMHVYLDGGKLDIYDKGMHKLQSLEIVTDLSEDEYTSKDNAELIRNSFEAVDVNFDGYPDIRILDVQDAGNTFYCYFVYEPTNGRFSYNKQLSGLAQPEFDEKGKTVNSYLRSSAIEYVEETYCWDDNGNLYIIRRRYATYNDKENAFICNDVNFDRNGDSKESQTVVPAEEAGFKQSDSDSDNSSVSKKNEKNDESDKDAAAGSDEHTTSSGSSSSSESSASSKADGK